MHCHTDVYALGDTVGLYTINYYIVENREEKSELCNRYLYLLNQCVYFRGCFVGFLLKTLLGFIHILLHFFPVHLHVPTMIGNLVKGIQ